MDTPEEFESKDRDFKAPDGASQPSESMPEWLKAETKQEFERVLNEVVESLQKK